MMIDAIIAEATRQDYVVARFREQEYKLPADVDAWPLDDIAVSVGVDAEDALVVAHNNLFGAMRTLLGEQWDGFVLAHPQRRDLLPASRAFAAAAGFAGQRFDLSFGALPRLLANLAAYPDAVEVTLAGMGLDYRDRWRFDADGCRRLTLRQIHVRLAFMPYDCALAIAQNDG